MKKAILLLGLLLMGASAGAGVNGWTGGGPEGGWILHLSRPDGPGGPIYAGSYAGGLWKSLDGGATWAEATENARDVIVRDVERGVDVQGSLYVATEDRGLLRTTAQGGFFDEVNAGLGVNATPAVYAVAQHVDQPLRITAATGVGIFTSRDRGNAWPDSLIWLAGDTVLDVETHPERPNVLHAITGRFYARSSDYGQSRVEVTAGLPSSPSLRAMEPWPAHPESVVVADAAGDVWLVTDDRFVAITPPLVAGRRSFYVGLRFDPEGGLLFVGSDRGVHCLHAKSRLWRFFDGGLDQAYVYAIEVDDGPAGDLLLGTFTRGVVTVRGEDLWTPTNTGLQASWVRSVSGRDGVVLVGTAHGGVHRSTDGGASWEDRTGDLTTLQILAVAMLEDGSWLAGGYDGIYRSEDEGATWVASSLPAGVARSYEYLQPGWAAAGTVIAACDQGVLSSLDHGRSWALRDTDLPVGRPVFAITAADTVAVVAAAFDLLGGQPAQLAVGAWDGTMTALDVPPGLSERGRALAFVGRDANRLVVGAVPYSGSPLYAVDSPLGEAAYEDLAGALPESFVFPRGMTSHRGSEEVLLATELLGVFRSSDGGATWTEWNEGLVTTRGDALALDGANPPKLVLGTLARGTWLRELPVSVPTLVQGPRVEVEAEGVWIEFEVSRPTELRVFREDRAGRSVRFEGRVEERVRWQEDLADVVGDEVAWIVEVEEIGRAHV